MMIHTAARTFFLRIVKAMIHAFGVNKRINYIENLALLLGQNIKDENNKTPKVLGNQNNKEDMYISIPDSTREASLSAPMSHAAVRIYNTRKSQDLN